MALLALTPVFLFDHPMLRIPYPPFSYPHYCSRALLFAASRCSPREAPPPLAPATVGTNTTGWSEFAENVSGEWHGHGAEFSIDGVPIELPERAVPEAFREWEVKLFDWQIQCAALAVPEEPTPAVSYKLIKLLPTVGCEADAATPFDIDERKIGGVNSGVSAFAYQSSGCYVAVWPAANHGGHLRSLELEHCLVDPRKNGSRVRILQSVRLKDGVRMSLQKIGVFCEQWYGPFRNGEELGGCGFLDSAFASTDAIRGSEVSGVWQQGPAAKAKFQAPKTNIFQELRYELGDGGRSIDRDEGDLILLPRRLWCSLKETGGGETCGEVGWVLDYGHALTSRCIFSSNLELKEMAVVHETAEIV